MYYHPKHLIKLIEQLKQLPGIGTKSAERFAFDMLSWPPELLEDIGDTIRQLPHKVSCCRQCGCLVQDIRCLFCEDAARDRSTICIIATPRDAFSLEKTRGYRGLYHVLGGLLSPLDNRGPECLTLSSMLNRIRQLQVQEIVIALDSTLEADATALFLKQELSPLNLRISRLAFGLPMGSSLDYVNEDTLARSLAGRHQF